MESSRTTYGVAARYLHWINAILLLGAFALHDFMEGNATLLWLHVVLGTAAFVVTAAQAVWYVVDTPPAELPGLAPWRKLAFTWNHRLILLAAFLACATGLGITLSSGVGLLPTVADLSTVRGGFFEEPHEITSQAMMLLFVMHFVGVLFYQFTKGNTLGRMAPLIFGRKTPK